MSMSRRLLFAVTLMVLAACAGEVTPDPTTIPVGPGAETPSAAIDQLVAALNEPDFEAAAELAVPGQAALASLAEGAPFDVVAEALRVGDRDVAANFWSGFAQGTQNFLTGPVDVSLDGQVEQDGVDFEVVIVVLDGGGTRSLLTRESDGYRVDLFASFGAGLADKMVTPVERLLTTQTDDARLILDRLGEIVPSLLAAASQPGTPTNVSQQLLALVEVITRVG